MSQLSERIKGLVGFFRRTSRTVPKHSRDPIDHVIMLDGTMSQLDVGAETNIGLIYKALIEVAATENVAVFYEAGVQWSDWGSTLDVIEGRGINRQIQRAYGWLASHYRPGDRIFLLGYSRGAFAARSLAGVIDLVGLLRADEATERNVREAYRHYQFETDPDVRAQFAEKYCHVDTVIECVGVFDTVKALGFRAPFVWKWAEVKHAFHSHELGPAIRHGYHALALNENREAFMPVLWECPPGYDGNVEQMWFRGSHGDVGGQLWGYHAARPLANIPLVWMMEKLEACQLPLPAGWRGRFPVNPDGPSVGTWRGWGKYFWARKRRIVGRDVSEVIHPTAQQTVPKLIERLSSA